MRKLVWIAVLAMLLSAAFVLAVEENVTKPTPCTDSDNGPTTEGKAEPFIGELGTIKYGISTQKSDECVNGPEGFHKDPSSFVREYYCGGSPVKVEHEDYDCTRFGYTKCEGGKCVGKTGTSTSSTTKTTTPGPACGNHHVDANEQCDPPDKICYLGDKVGVCSRLTCQCKVYNPGGASETPPATEEKPPVESSPPTTVRVTHEETPPAAQPEEQPPAEAAPEERQPLPSDEVPAKGIGVTRAITNSVKKFFSWIGSWF